MASKTKTLHYIESQNIFHSTSKKELTIFTAFTFFTKEKVVDIGNVEITSDKPHHLNWSPLVGLGVMAVGGMVLWQSTKK